MLSCLTLAWLHYVHYEFAISRWGGFITLFNPLRSGSTSSRHYAGRRGNCVSRERVQDQGCPGISVGTWLGHSLLKTVLWERYQPHGGLSTSNEDHRWLDTHCCPTGPHQVLRVSSAASRHIDGGLSLKITTGAAIYMVVQRMAGCPTRDVHS